MFWIRLTAIRYTAPVPPSIIVHCVTPRTGFICYTAVVRLWCQVGVCCKITKVTWTVRQSLNLKICFLKWTVKTATSLFTCAFFYVVTIITTRALSLTKQHHTLGKKKLYEHGKSGCDGGKFSWRIIAWFLHRIIDRADNKASTMLSESGSGFHAMSTC